MVDLLHGARSSVSSPGEGGKETSRGEVEGIRTLLLPTHHTRCHRRHCRLRGLHSLPPPLVLLVSGLTSAVHSLTTLAFLLAVPSFQLPNLAAPHVINVKAGLRRACTPLSELSDWARGFAVVVVRPALFLHLLLLLLPFFHPQAAAPRYCYYTWLNNNKSAWFLRPFWWVWFAQHINVHIWTWK